MTSKLEAVHLGRLDWRATPKDQQCQAVRRLRRHVYFTSAKLLDFMPPLSAFSCNLCYLAFLLLLLLRYPPHPSLCRHHVYMPPELTLILNLRHDFATSVVL